MFNNFLFFLDSAIAIQANPIISFKNESRLFVYNISIVFYFNYKIFFKFDNNVTIRNIHKLFFDFKVTKRIKIVIICLPAVL